MAFCTAAKFCGTWAVALAISSGVPRAAVALASGVSTVLDSQVPSPVQAGGMGSIAGRVMDDGSPSRPLGNVLVSVLNARGAPVLSTFTDENGRFYLASVPAGRFQLAASKAGFTPAFFESTSQLHPGVEVVVTPRGSTIGLDLTLRHQALISGRVVDALQEAVADATIAAVRIETQPDSDRPSYLAVASAVTNDLGEYRLSGLPEGEYLVAAYFPVQRTWHPLAPAISWAALASTHQLIDLPKVAAASDRSLLLYPGVSTVEEARTISVSFGQSVAAIDFVLKASAAARLIGTASSPSGADMGAIEAMVFTRPQGLPAMAGQAAVRRCEVHGNVFSLDQLQPGSYTVLVRARSADNENGPVTSTQKDRDLVGIANVSIGSGEIARLALQLTSGTEVTGALTVPPNLRNRQRSIAMILSPEDRPDTTFFALPPVFPDDAGHFVIPNIPAGTYQLGAQIGSTPVYLKAGGDARSEPGVARFEVSGTRVNIAVTAEATAEIEGILMAEDGRASYSTSSCDSNVQERRGP